jgi:biotin transporter BioY
MGNGTGGRGAIAALVAGLIAVVGGPVVVTTDGGLGTGNGIAGGYVALVLRLTAAVLGRLARARSRRCAG